jgi:hypothetical protein
MAFNIDRFIGNGLTGGGARPSLFEVFMNFPATAGIPTDVGNKFRFTCRATSIPASTVASVDVPYFGRTIKLAGDRTFTDWNVTVMNDEDYIVRNAFEAWHNSINSIVSNRRVLDSTSDGTGFKQTALVNHYSKEGNDKVIKSYNFVGLFPVSVDEMALDWESTNTIQTFGVTFAYDYWEPTTVSPSPDISVDI